MVLWFNTINSHSKVPKSKVFPVEKQTLYEQTNICSYNIEVNNLEFKLRLIYKHYFNLLSAGIQTSTKTHSLSNKVNVLISHNCKEAAISMKRWKTNIPGSQLFFLIICRRICLWRKLVITQNEYRSIWLSDLCLSNYGNQTTILGNEWRQEPWRMERC